MTAADRHRESVLRLEMACRDSLRALRDQFGTNKHRRALHHAAVLHAARIVRLRAAITPGARATP